MACPICRRDSVPGYRPFCSARCADVDLGRWLRGAYVIAGDPSTDLASDRSAHEKNADEGLDRHPKRP